MKYIPLTKNKLTIVDDDDYEELAKYKWFYNNGYAARYLGYNPVTGLRKQATMHRIIMHTPQGMDTDHINRNRLDNRKINLRICDRSTNVLNRSDWRLKAINTKLANGTLGNRDFAGITYHTKHKLWQLRLSIDRKQKHIGLYRTRDDALYAKKQFIKQLNNNILY